MKRILLLVLCLPVLAHAAKITARLDVDETVVGTPVRFEVRVEGGGDAILPSSVDIDGIETIQTLRSTQT